VQADCPTEGTCAGVYGRARQRCPHHGRESCVRGLEHAHLRQEAWFVAARIPPLYQEPDVRRVPQLAALRAWMDGYRAGSPRGLILSGGTGVGKTMALTYLCMGVGDTRAPGEVQVWYAPELSAWLIDPAHDLGELVRLQLLCVDDWGCEYVGDRSGWLVSRVEELAERRHRERRPVVVTTNLGPEAFGARDAWARVTDRWQDTCDWVSFTGPSQRGRESELAT
jgi:DNA replication protein DnaC